MKTISLCPECLQRIEAEVYEDNGKVLMRKRECNVASYTMLCLIVG